MPPQRNIIVTMDVTGLGALGGLFLARSNRQHNLYWRYVEHESVSDYLQAVEVLFAIGHDISGFIVDGKPGVIKTLQRLYPHIPCQYCQFHQMKTVKGYIPQHAQSEAARSLRALALRLANYHYIQFETALQIWKVIYEDFLSERTICTDTKNSRTWRYTHGRLRSAYNSLRRHLPYLYTYQKHPTAFMGNTANVCDGFFAHFKERLGRHRGLSVRRKRKMSDYLLENW